MRGYGQAELKKLDRQRGRGEEEEEEEEEEAEEEEGEEEEEEEEEEGGGALVLGSRIGDPRCARATFSGTWTTRRTSQSLRGGNGGMPKPSGKRGR